MSTPIQTFRRNLRRLEKRAIRMRLTATRDHLRALRLDPHPDHAADVRATALYLRDTGRYGWRFGPYCAFLLTRAADAVDRLRAALRTET